MYKWGKKSAARLATVDPRLRLVMNEALLVRDVAILCGERGEEEQNRLFDEGKSQVRFPDSKHNVQVPGKLATAVDATPYPLAWEDREQMTLFAGLVLGIAKARRVRIRWGGDWDGDFRVINNKFDDLVHFELME